MENHIIKNKNKPLGYMRLPQVLELIPVGKSTWWAGVKDGRFPSSVKLSERVTVWKSEDIYNFIDQQNKKGGRDEY